MLIPSSEPLHSILYLWQKNIYEIFTIGSPLISPLSYTLLLKIKEKEKERLSIAFNTSGWQTEITCWFWLLRSKSLNFLGREQLEDGLYLQDLRSRRRWWTHCALPWAGIRRGAM